MSGVRYQLEILGLDSGFPWLGNDAVVGVLNDLKAWRGFVALEFRWAIAPGTPRPVRFWVVADFDRAVPGTRTSLQTLMALAFPSVEWGEAGGQGIPEGLRFAAEIRRQQDLVTFEDPQAEVVQFVGLSEDGELRLNRRSRAFVHPWVNPWVPPDDTLDLFIRFLLGLDQDFVLSFRVVPTRPLPGEKNLWSMPVVPNRRPRNLRLEAQSAPRPELMTIVDNQLRKMFQTVAESWEGGVFLGRVHVFSTQTLSQTVLGRVGRHLTKPAGVPSVGYGEGGFSVRRWSQVESTAVLAAWAAGLETPFEAEDGIPGKERLQYLFPTAEAAQLLKAPQLCGQAFPGLPSRLFRRPEAPVTPFEGVRWGWARAQGQRVEVLQSVDDRLRHAFIIGQTGTGKSSLLAQMILQDIEAGRGVGVIDPHGDLIDFLLDRIPRERIDDVVLVDPLDEQYPIGLNPLEAQGCLERDFVINGLIDLFYALFTYQTVGGPMFEMYLRNTLTVLMDQKSGPVPGLTDVLTFLQDPSARERWLAGCKNTLAVAFWEKEAGRAGGDLSLENLVPYVTSKFGRFLYNHTLRRIFAQPRSTIDFRRVLDDQRILLVDLRKGALGEQAGQFLAMVLAGKLLGAALSRSTDRSRGSLPPFFLYVDELHLVANQSLMTALSESRKYGLGLVAATQYTGQLKPQFLQSVLGNVGTIVGFRMGQEDARLLEPVFRPALGTDDLTNIENHQCYLKLLTKNVPLAGFHLTLAPPLPLPLASFRQDIIESSRLRHGGSIDIAENCPEEDNELSDYAEKLAKLFGE